MVTITIDREKPQPIYKQIAQQIRNSIRNGTLLTGSRLPPIRQVAQQLSVTRATVQNAYNELAEDGWVVATVGKGTFVNGSASLEALMAQVDETPTFQEAFPAILRIVDYEWVRSFSEPEPDPRLFPVNEFLAYMYTEKSNISLWRYGRQLSHLALVTGLSKLLGERGVDVNPQRILITTGVRHSLSIVLNVLTQPGEPVAIEMPSILGLVHILKAHDRQVVPIPFDSDGPCLDALEQAVREHGLRLFVITPASQNPTGITMSVSRHHDLLELARRYGLTLIENDINGLLSLDGHHPPALKSFDKDDRVVYINSFAKTLSPGLKIGYMVAPEPVHNKLNTMITSFFASNIVKAALAHMLNSGRFHQHLETVIPIYRQRRDRLLSELCNTGLRNVRWTSPGGGFACLLTLENGLEADLVARRLLRTGFVVKALTYFTQEYGFPEMIRICYGAQPEHYITEMVNSLARIIREEA